MKNAYYFMLLTEAFNQAGAGFLYVTPGRVSATWFSAKERGLVTPLVCGATYAGVAFGFLLLPNTVSSVSQYPGLLYTILGLQSAASMAIYIYFPSEPPLPPSFSEYTRRQERNRIKEEKQRLKEMQQEIPPRSQELSTTYTSKSTLPDSSALSSSSRTLSSSPTANQNLSPDHTPDNPTPSYQSSSAPSVTVNVMDESFDLSTSSSLYLTAAPVTVYSLPTVSPL